MARTRSLDPDVFKDDVLAECSPFARLLLFGLWGHCDREGRMKESLKRIKAECLPYDGVDVDVLLQELHDCGSIVRYEAEGIRYLWVREFKEQQRITGKEALRPSDLPPPPCQGNSGETTGKEEVFHGERRSVSRGNTDETESASRGNEPRSPLDSPSSPQHSPSPPLNPPNPGYTSISLDSAWAEFCQVYPKRSGSHKKAPAEVKFRWHVTTGKADPAAILDGARRYRDWCNATGKTGTELVSMMLTWLNQRGWLEEYELSPEVDNARSNGKPAPKSAEELAKGALARMQKHAH